MLEFNKKKTYRKLIYSPTTLFLLGLIFLILLKALWGVYQKERTSAHYLSREQEQLAAVAVREKELTRSVEYLKSEKGMESEMRNRFRVVREGESVTVIVDPTATTTPVKPPAQVSQSTFLHTYFRWMGL